MTVVRIGRLVPFAAILTTGCFATRNDVRLLQADIARRDSASAQLHRADAERARIEQQRRDSVYQSELRTLVGAARAHSDSLMALSAAFWRFRANQIASNDSTSQELYTIGEMLKASLGSNQKVIAALKNIEEQRATASPDSTQADRPPTAASMYQLGRDELSKGAHQTAISVFKDLLKQYPNDDLVPAALMGLAEAYAADGKEAASDSVLVEVVERFPKTKQAPTALYKRGKAAEATRPSEARKLYDKILTEYRQSPEAQLAAEGKKRLGG